MGKGKGEEDENVERGNWSGKLDFFLSCVGYAVGVGNVWRFPTLCFRNGGVSFVIPYLIMLFIGGMPLFLFELTLGQFSSQGPVTVWRVNPLFVGVGWGMIAISTLVAIYYNTIIMYSLYYMMVAFVNMDDKLPWTKCGQSWNTNLCKDTPYPNFLSMSTEEERFNGTMGIMNQTCARSMDLLEAFNNATNSSIPLDFDNVNSTILQSATYTACKWKYGNPSNEYWTRYVLGINNTDYIGNLGEISWKLFVALIFSWVIVFFCLMKGIKSSGRVVYFTATFPYIILIVLLIRGLTLPGYEKGIEFYIVPTSESWEKLKDPKIWGDAATQIFYSLGPAFGGLLTMASYNKFKNNCYRDAVIVPIINCGTSIFAGFAIFSLMGFIAHETNQDVTNVTDIGPGLAFVAYPAGIGQLPGAPIWAFLFFFMMITLGLDSQFGMMETIISGISDVFPILRKKKTLFTFFCCTAGFLLAIPQVFQGGMYVFSLMDWYSGSYGLLILCLFELIGVCWIYGIRNFANDFKMMIGYRPNIFWLGTWVVVTPVMIIFIFIMMAINNSPAVYGTYQYEEWAQGIGWALVALPVVLIFGGMIGQIIRYHLKGNTGILQSIKRTAHHTEDWGPALDQHRAIDPERYPPLDTLEMNNIGNKYAVKNEGYENDNNIISHKL